MVEDLQRQLSSFEDPYNSAAERPPVFPVNTRKEEAVAAAFSNYVPKSAAPVIQVKVKKSVPLYRPEHFNIASDGDGGDGPADDDDGDDDDEDSDDLYEEDKEDQEDDGRAPRIIITPQTAVPLLAPARFPPTTFRFREKEDVSVPVFPSVSQLVQWRIQ
eukprot:15233688-Heterocapsa_arctica.AAC.1